MRNGTYSVGESSSSTSMSSQQDVEDDRMIAQVLTEEYAKLDGAVGRRLSNLAPVPVSYLVSFLNFVMLWHNYIGSGSSKQTYYVPGIYNFSF